jgi:hypothetical protein
MNPTGGGGTAKARDGEAAEVCTDGKKSGPTISGYAWDAAASRQAVRRAKQVFAIAVL